MKPKNHPRRRLTSYETKEPSAAASHRKLRRQYIVNAFGIQYNKGDAIPALKSG